jgi:hypothetical protein
MTTVGKSDLLEAVVQLLVLTVLREGAPKTIRTVKRHLLAKTAAISFISESSVSMAATKLEISGWIRKERLVRRDDHGRYVLTDTAIRMFALEVRDWTTCGAQWSEIDRILRTVLRPLDRERDN